MSENLNHDPERRTVYVDMDGVVANYYDHAALYNTKNPGYFLSLPLMDGAVEAITELSKYFNVYFLSTAPWSNPFAWMEKREWLEQHFGELAFKRLILSHNKGLNRGDYLIDDRTANGVEGFKGEHIHFGTEKFPGWGEVVRYLVQRTYPCENPQAQRERGSLTLPVKFLLDVINNKERLHKREDGSSLLLAVAQRERHYYSSEAKVLYTEYIVEDMRTRKFYRVNLRQDGLEQAVATRFLREYSANGDITLKEALARQTKCTSYV